MEMRNLAAGMAIFLEGHTSELKVSGRIFHTVTSAAGHGRGYALPPATFERRPRARKEAHFRDFAGGPVVRNMPCSAGDVCRITGRELRSRTPRSN